MSYSLEELDSIFFTLLEHSLLTNEYKEDNSDVPIENYMEMIENCLHILDNYREAEKKNLKFRESLTNMFKPLERIEVLKDEKYNQ